MMSFLASLAFFNSLIISLLYARKVYLHYAWLRMKNEDPISEDELAINTLYFRDRHYLSKVASLSLIKDYSAQQVEIDKKNKINILIQVLAVLIIIDLLTFLLNGILEKI